MHDSGPYKTRFKYDWQDRIVSRVLPDDTTISTKHNGGLVVSIALDSQSFGQVAANFESYSAFEKPEKVEVAGSALAGVFTHNHEYDAQGYPSLHSLKAKSGLVQNHYLYGDTDQLGRVHEFISGETVDYTYDGQRLASSQTGTGVKNVYAYDPSGNLTEKGDIGISYGEDHAIGTKGGKTTFEIAYDRAGRMRRRSADDDIFAFDYNSFGSLCSIPDTKDNATTRIVSDSQGHTLARQLPDVTREVIISGDFDIIIRPDGSQQLRHRLYGVGNDLLATILTNVEAGADRSKISTHSAEVFHCDTKGSITHRFKGDHSPSTKILQYEDYGSLIPSADEPPDRNTKTREGRFVEQRVGLLDFNARWYDPLVARFASPDDITDVDSLLLQDGLNRYTFENNDPINHVDPTGHWSWSSLLGVVLGVALIVATVAITIATGRVAAPLAAIALGA